MKKLALLTLLVAFAWGANAQYGSKEQKSALRTVLDIEQSILTANTDTTGVRLINEHKTAKKAMQDRLMKSDGYGNIAKDKPSIDKFREKTAKKDARFAALDKKEKETEKAKADYLKANDEKYNAAYPIAYP